MPLLKCKYCGAAFKARRKYKQGKARLYCSTRCATLARFGYCVEDEPWDGPRCRICDIPIDGKSGDLCYNCSRAVTEDIARDAAAVHASHGKLYTRRCATCGKPCSNYRCPECARKWRAQHGVDTDESEYGLGFYDDEDE